jgi:hypothetical protein
MIETASAEREGFAICIWVPDAVYYGQLDDADRTGNSLGK